MSDKKDYINMDRVQEYYNSNPNLYNPRIREQIKDNPTIDSIENSEYWDNLMKKQRERDEEYRRRYPQTPLWMMP